jgi:predicted  nucleic acid-binding Zn-ribbon protein
MHPIIAKLIELERVEFMLESAPAADAEKRLATQASTLRAEIPAPILAHFDRVEAQGKTPVVAVITGNCQGCHLHLSTSAQAALLDKSDLHLCEHCGRYIYLPKTESGEVQVDSSATPKPTPHGTKKRTRSASVTLAMQ